MHISYKNITAYINYLRKTGFVITLHGLMINESVFLKYNFHQNPYCHYVKTVYCKWDDCIKRQSKVIDKAKSGSYFGCCYAGVGEFIYPIKHEDEVVGFVSVSGYRDESSLPKAKHFAVKNEIPIEEITDLMNRHLKKDVPDKDFMDSVIDPLIFMLEEYYSNSYEDGGADDKLYHKLIRYVTENSHSRITMEELSQKYSYSVSTLSHLFTKHTGMTLPEYINYLRLGEAKWYLENSDSSVSEIALFLGYSSSNYFSSVFKKKYGVTPKKYRSTFKLKNKS